VGAALAAACSAPPFPRPPETRVAEVTDTLHGVSFADPYRWLEDQASPETRRFIDAQNAYADEIVGRTPLRARLEMRLRELMDRPDIGSPALGGDLEYFTLRRKGMELPIIYRRPAPKDKDGKPRRERIDPAGDYDVVIDPHPMSAAHTTRVEIVAVEGNGRHLLYAVRDGGQDEFEIRARDLAAGADVPDRLPSALYSSVSFKEDGSGFYYSRRSRQTGARIYLHTWGTPIEQDVVVFGEGYGPTAFVSMDQADGARYLIFTVQHGWARSEVHVLDMKKGGPVRPIVTDADARFYPRFVDGELWMRTDLDSSNNRVVAVDLAQPSRDRWRVVIPESDDVLEDFTVIGKRIYATYLHDASNRIRVFGRDGTPAGEVDVAPYHSASIRGVGDTEALLTLSGFVTPETVWRINLDTGARTLEEKPEILWDPSGVEVEQVRATSKDGTRVPMFVVHKPGVPRDGRTSALLTGYGGFYAASKPGFNPMAAVWIESGGVFALANMRGGSEYGERWHRAGMLTNKQRVVDDFLAAAEWLVANKYTSPDRLAIAGTSNGGLLVGAALTQRPDLFRAVYCGFPDVDILRFNQYTRNNNMPALLEYGDAAIPEQFEAIRQYSPYQNVRAGTRYPAVMLESGDLDTRVPPLAARKFTARLQAATASGLPIILRYNPKGGHAANRGLPFSRRVEDTAMELTFLMTQTGLASQ
jgi:prolyl oligopeptidase